MKRIYIRKGAPMPSAAELEGVDEVVWVSDPMTWDEALQRLAEAGSEPFWVQDIRLAQRRLWEARQALRGHSDRSGHPENEGEAT